MTKRSLRISLFIVAAVVLGWSEDPVKTTVCAVKADPAAFNHKLIEVTGFVSHDFEDFTIFDPACDSWPAIWLEYGGTSRSGTMYCCGVSDNRTREQQMVVENIPIPLVVNGQFKQFDKAIQPPYRSGSYGALAHATIVGRFFAGQRIKYRKDNSWGGYGHIGCCSLLTIQEIKSLDTENRTDLDYGASPDQLDTEKTGCGYRFLMPFDDSKASVELQQEQADKGERTWALDDPLRVATDALSQGAHVGEASVQGVRLIREGQGRKVYEWQPAGKAGPYMVVVSRPSWLSFYAKDKNRVAWVVIAAYESTCDE